MMGLRDPEMIQEMRKSNAAKIVDDEVSRVQPNQTLLDPASTPDKLKVFTFGVGCPCPTRTMTRETALALRQLVYPMFGNALLYSPDGMEVGEARNHIVECGLRDGVEWMFFLDYDVAPPPNALVKLLSLKVPIAAGVYHLKQVPSYPLIQIKGWDYAFEDYEIGDLIKADGSGMGCTLIKMDVFKKIEKPWFKTVHQYVGNGSRLLPGMTEDIYFCEKARAAGFDIIVDTSIQCGHVDWRTGLIFSLIPDPTNPKKGIPGWTWRSPDNPEVYITQTVATADHPAQTWAKSSLPTPKRDAIDLGSGPWPPEGFTGIDLFHENDNVLKGSIEDLGWYREEHGLVKRLRASHSLEHMSHRSVPRIFRDWVSTLEKDGEMEVRVPDGEYHMRAFVEMIDEGKDVDPQCDWLNATLFGYQIGDGQEHKTLFTKHRLEQLALTSGLVDVNVERVEHEGNEATLPKTGELVLTGKRG